MGTHASYWKIGFLAAVLAVPLAGCHSNVRAAMQDQANPADANMVPLQGNGQQNEAVTQAATYQNGQPTGATNQVPIERQTPQGSYSPQDQQQQGAYQNPNAQNANGQYANGQDPNGQYTDDQADLGGDALDEAMADTAPPPLPQYEQPEAPGPDYIWTPGYWDYAPVGYYWVPGAWVYPPYVGALWTPGYWGWYGGHYRFRHGYWGPHVGFYGGVNYGFGYIGYGYQGGYWNNNHFYYNRAVNRVSPVRVNNYVYVRNVTINRTYINNSRVSYYGGRGGLNRAPVPQERAAFREQHVRPMTMQVQTRQQAMSNRNSFFQANGGRPQVASIARGLNADRGYQRPAMNLQNPQNQPRPNYQQPQRQGFGQNGVQNGAPAQRPDFRGGNNPAMQPQRQQMDEQRRQQFQQQRQTNAQQNLQQQQEQGRQQMEQRQQQALQGQQQRQEQERQRQQQMQQQRDAQANNAQRQQQMEQRQQVENQRMQQRQQQETMRQQQRQVADQQRQVQNQQRQQQMQQQRQMQQQMQQQHMPQRQPIQQARPPMQAPHPGGGGGGGGHGPHR